MKCTELSFDKIFEKKGVSELRKQFGEIKSVARGCLIACESN